MHFLSAMIALALSHILTDLSETASLYVDSPMPVTAPMHRIVEIKDDFVFAVIALTSGCAGTTV